MPLRHRKEFDRERVLLFLNQPPGKILWAISELVLETICKAKKLCENIGVIQVSNGEVVKSENVRGQVGMENAEDSQTDVMAVKEDDAEVRVELWNKPAIEE